MMKIKLAILATCAACALTLVAADDGHTDDYQSGPIDVPVMRNDKFVNGFLRRHESRLARIAKHQSKHYDIVFFGDSITHNWERANKGSDVYGQKVWQEEFAGMKVLNCGFGGDRVENCHWRAENGELAGYKADVFCVLIGTNNRQNTSEEISGGVKAFVKKIEECHPESRIVLMTILPRCDIDPPKVTEEIIARVRGANPLIRQWAAQDDRITLLDLDEFFQNPDGSVKKELFNDGIHPNEAGYRIWARELKKAIAPR